MTLAFLSSRNISKFSKCIFNFNFEDGLKNCEGNVRALGLVLEL
jgi:hypothetical protein